MFISTGSNSYIFLILGAGNRYRMQQLQQKDWCEQQIKEKQLKKEVEKINNLAFDAQTMQFTETL